MHIHVRTTHSQIDKVQLNTLLWRAICRRRFSLTDKGVSRVLFTPAGPNALLNWFWYGRHPYRFLVLLAAGGVGQAGFFKEVFEQKENLDIVSGPDIAVFLFGDKSDSGIGLKGSEPGEFVIIPGRQVGLGQRESDAGLRMVRISELPSSSRDSVVRKSMTATTELCERLKLDETHIPGILVLSKVLGEEDVLVVRTQDAASVGDFLEFLRALRAIAARLPPSKIGPVAATAKVSRNFPVEEYWTVRRTHEEAKADLRREMAALIEGLVEHGLPSADLERLRTEVDRLLGRSSRLGDFLGRLRLDWLVSSSRLDNAAVQAIRTSVLSDERLKDAIHRIRTLLRTTQQLGNRYRKFDRTLKSIAQDQDQYLQYLSEQENILEEIDRLTLRYEKRFLWLRRAQKLGYFIKIATGLAKQAKDIHDIASLLRKASQSSS